LYETLWDGSVVRGDTGFGGGRGASTKLKGSQTLSSVPETENGRSQTGSSSLTFTLREPAVPSDPEKPSVPLAYRLAAPALLFTSHLCPFHGLLLPSSRCHWHHVAARPLLLFLYPSTLYSSFLYACSLG
jgi:hypothetical protein